MAGNFQQVIVIGSVGRDAESRDVGQSQLVSFTLAVKESWRDERDPSGWAEKTTWFSINCWDQRTGEQALRIAKKGANLMIVGTISARAYMDKNNQMQSSLDVRAQTLRVLGNRPEGEGGGNYDAPPPSSNASSGGGNRGGNRPSGGNQSRNNYDDYDSFTPPPKDESDIPF